MATTTPGPAEHEHGHPGIVLATLALASVMSVMNLFVVNVALNDIGAHLHSSLSDVAWVLNAYALFFGALLVPAGRFSDKYGQKNVFMLGLAVFTIASLACAVSPDLWVLIVFRCVQGIGAAMLIPSSLGLVLTTMPPARVKRSVRLWAVSGAAAGAIGPVLGGLLTSLSWRWIFLINLPIGITAIAVTWKMIPNVRHDRSTKMPDPIGSLMAILTIGAISFGLLNGHTWGWGNGRIIASWIVAVVAAVGFVISTRRAPVPAVEPQMFRSRVFSAANVSIVIAATIFGMQLLGMSLFLQQAWHWSTTDTGLAIAPGPAAILMSSFIAQKLNEKLPVGLVVAFGFGIVAAGQILMVLLLKGGGHSYAADILPGLVPDRHRLRVLDSDDHRLSDSRPARKAQRDGQCRGQRRPPGRRCLRHSHPRRDPRQGSHDRRPDAVLPLVVGSGRHLRRCRRDLPRPNAPSPDRGGEGDCR